MAYEYCKNCDGLRTLHYPNGGCHYPKGPEGGNAYWEPQTGVTLDVPSHAGIPFADLESACSQLITAYQAACSAIGVKSSDTVKQLKDVLVRVQRSGASPGAASGSGG